MGWIGKYSLPIRNWIENGFNALTDWTIGATFEPTKHDGYVVLEVFHVWLVNGKL